MFYKDLNRTKFIQSSIDESVWLRVPEIEIVARANLWQAYLNNKEIFIRAQFPLFKLSTDYSKNWQQNPFKDMTWALYFHSLYFIGTLYHGVTLSPEYHKIIKQDLSEILLSYFDFLEQNDIENDNCFAWDDHATAYRASYIALAYSTILVDNISPNNEKLFKTVAKKHADILCSFLLSNKWSHSNHTLFHIEALCDIASTFFKNTKEYSSYIDIAIKKFNAYFESAISCKDGTTKEHAFFYHAFLMERIAAHVDFLRINNISVRNDIDNVLTKMNRFLWIVMPIPGYIPSIGDTKYDMIVDSKYYSRFLTNPYIDDTVRYIHSNGKKGIMPSYFNVFQDDGFYIFRDFRNLIERKELISIFLEKKQIGPHGHCDGGSFVTFINNEPLFIDSGGPFKYGNKMRYEYFQDQCAHNTVVLNKPERYHSEVMAFNSNANYAFVLSKVNFKEGAIWYRLFGQIESQTIIVLDIVTNSTSSSIFSLFHLSPNCTINKIDNNQYKIGLESSRVGLYFDGSTYVDISNDKTSTEEANWKYFGKSYVTQRDGEYLPSQLILRRIQQDVPALLSVGIGEFIPEVELNEQDDGANILLSDKENSKELYSIRIGYGKFKKPHLDIAKIPRKSYKFNDEMDKKKGDKKMSTNAQAFLQNGFEQVNGWLNAKVLAALDCCVQIMKDHDHKWENTLEIGVHEGKFFIPIELVTPNNKKACAIDVFDLQMFNIDKSGHGNYERFVENINKYCILPSRIIVEREDSFNIISTSLGKLKYSIMSIDGGHTINHVNFDLKFAANQIQSGGLIILDDFPNASWLGVLEGATIFFNKRESRIAPFATGYNKLFITTVSHQKIYFEAIRKKAPNFGLDLGRITEFAGWPIQALAKRHFRPL